MLNHPAREMNRLASRALLAGCLALASAACEESPPPRDVPVEEDSVERQLDVQREVMHQTQEVLRYMDDEERLRREREAEFAALADHGDDNISQEQPNNHE